MSDLINNSDFFNFHNNNQQQLHQQQNLKNSINLGKSIEWMNNLYDPTTMNCTGTQSTKSSTGFNNSNGINMTMNMNQTDGNNSPSNFLNLNLTPILTSNMPSQLHYIDQHQQQQQQQQQQHILHQHQQQQLNSSDSIKNNNITYDENNNCYISPIGSPVPSYYSNSSNQSSPQQQHIDNSNNNNYYSPQSPTSSNTTDTNNNNNIMQQLPLNTTMSIPNFINQNVPSSPNHNNNLIHPENYNLVLNFIPQQNQNPYLLPSISYQQPQHVQQQQQFTQHKSKQQKVQHSSNPQQDFSILNTIYQPSISNVVSLQSETLEEFMEKPFSEESFLNSLKSVVPSLQDNIDTILSSSHSSDSSSPESDMEPNSSRGGKGNKKRLRDDDSTNDGEGSDPLSDEHIDTSGCTILPRDKILKLTSKEIEEYVSKLKQNHTLSPAQEKELKKQRRLIKNREYASQSRSRRKQYVETIEQKLQKTNQEVLSFKNQISAVKEENKLLKKQLFTFSATLKSNPSLAELFGKIFQPTGNSSTKAAASLSIFVFFLLFTFTFFLPTQLNSPFSVTHSEKSFLQRNLLNHDTYENMSPLNVIYEKSLQMKSIIYEQGKDYIEKMFGSLSMTSSGTENNEYFKNMTEKSTVATNNEQQEQQPSQYQEEKEETTIVNPPSLIISNTAVEKENIKLSLESNSPPLSPLTE